MTFTSPTGMRNGFGQALVELGRSNPDVVALTADLSEPTRVHWFAEKFPDRFFQMGISENDMIGTAAGLAHGGKIPFATTFAIFGTSLANQPVRLHLGYNHFNVKLVCSHGGVTVGPDGATHQAFEDFALMRLIPGLTVVAPCDANEAYKATLAIAAYDGPVYMRVGRIDTPVVTVAETPFTLGKANVLRDGDDLAVFCIGSMVPTALEAADVLAGRGINCRVVNVHTLKPLDEKTVLEAAGACGAVVTAEEHTVLGGLGGAVSEVLSRLAPTPVEMVGVNDTFGESGEPAEILLKYGLTSEAIVDAALRAVSRKGSAG